MIFLRSSIDTTMNRIQKRNRAGEAENINIVYLEKLGKFYDKFWKKLSAKMDPAYLITIDTDDLNAEEVFQESLRKVQNLLTIHFSSAAERNLSN